MISGNEGNSLAAIRSTMSEMEREVRRGNFEKAAERGNLYHIPLGIAKAELQLKQKLHHGEQGSVFQGTWREKAIAAKKAKISTHADMSRFRMEIQLLLILGEHQNIVPLLGARLLPPDYMLILPLWSQNLAELLHREGWRPDWKEIGQIALQLACGLEHIHSNGILHRDIKPANTLSGLEGQVGITDFGIAVLEAELASEFADRQCLVGQQNPSGGFHKRHLVGTLEYLAPEVLLKQAYSYPADIYSWSVTVNELCTRVVPFSDCTKDNPAAHTVLNFGYGRQELAAAIVSEGLRPLLNPATPPSLSQILEECWQLQSGKRPNASTLVSRLEAALRGGEYHANPLSDMPEGSISTKMREAARKMRDLPGVIQPDARHLRDLLESCFVAPSWLSDGLPDSPQKVSVGSFATAGARGPDRMEDRHAIHSPLHPSFLDGHLLAVFDGHRGSEAAAFAAQVLQQAFSEALPAGSGEACLKECFTKIDSQFRHAEDLKYQEMASRMGKASMLRRWPGCTALVALLSGQQLWVAAAGDGRAVLCRRGNAVVLNEEHSAELVKERQRIESVGGQLQEVGGVWRIGQAGLQVTRSFGDADLKTCGVISEPDITTTVLEESDPFLILATDGLWDVISSQQAVDLVRDTVKEPTMCAQRLVTEAISRGSGDNISVIIMFLQPVETVEKIFSSASKYSPSN